MRIVQIIDQLGTGGAERVCVNLVNLFARHGYHVTLVVFDEKGSLFPLIDENVEVIILNKKQSKLKAYKKMVNLFQPGDIIHVHMRQTYRFLQKAFFLFGKRKKVILHDHYGKININKKVPMFYRTLFKPDIYIGCSALLTDWAIHRLKMNKNHVFLINNFVLKEKSIATNGVIPKGLVLVANLKEVKNHAFAIQLAHKLNQDLTIYCTHISGDYYQKLNGIIKSLDYTDRVKFITGCSNVQKELHSYEMGLLTSFSEGDPLVIIEYLAQGLPCLVSNVGEAVKVIKEQFPCMVQDNFNLEKWEQAYTQAKKIKPEEIERLYNQNFAEDLYLNQYLKVYETLKKNS